MQLTLRNARRLERAIEQHIVGLAPLFQTRNIQISIYENFEETVAALQTKVIDAVTVAERMVGIRTAIRRLIQNDNEVSGLNKLIAEEASLRATAKVLEQAKGLELTPAEKAIAKKRHDAAVTTGAVQDQYGRVSDVTTLPATLEKATLDVLTVKVKEIQKRLLQITDESTARNTTRLVTVSDDDIAFLEANEIVV